MKIALIGCGRISKNHLKAIVKNDLDLIAVCDLNLENMDNVVKNYPNNKTEISKYFNYIDLLSNEEFDIAVIATDSGSHAEIALKCIDKGVNLIIEKPITLNIAEANLIVEKSKEKNLKVATCMQNRFNMAVQETRFALENNKFGKMSHGNIQVLWNRNKEYYDQANWRGTWAHDGGSLMNQSIHGVDLLCWMFDYQIDEVYGVLQNRFHAYFEAEDIGTAIIKFKDGSIGTIQGTTNIYPENLEETLLLVGEKGTVKIGGKAVNKIEYWNVESISNPENMDEQIDNVYGNGHNAIYSDMIDAIKNDRDPYVDAEDGKNALQVILAIYKSHKEGKPVKLPLEDFSTLDMIGEEKLWK